MAEFSWVDRNDAALCLWLDVLRDQRAHFERCLYDLCNCEGSLHEFCIGNGLHFFGLNRTEMQNGWWYREWAPAASACSLVGDFNEWNITRHPCQRRSSGIFEVFVPDDGPWRLEAGGRYKTALRVRSAEGERLVHRIPAWCRRTIQNPTTGEFFAVAMPAEQILSYSWQHMRPDMGGRTALRVYEAHVGISSLDPIVADWSHFRVKVLPRVVALGYTALLLLGVAEHGYYASFGYQVPNVVQKRHEKWLGVPLCLCPGDLFFCTVVALRRTLRTASAH